MNEKLVGDGVAQSESDEIRQLRIDNARLRDEAFLRSRGDAQAAWQPIATAPKDGPIMLCVAGYLPCTGRWWPVDSCWTSFDWEGHFESDKETSDYVNGSSYEPTHWMPLPPGPSVSSTHAAPRSEDQS